mmetsp:Transcript_16879/g.58912  ORF Transcript_16879/g.58912 Transcript_16879/m.58912 type:complete len:252 (-) Transcript_16879:439-1194(-)
MTSALLAPRRRQVAPDTNAASVLGEEPCVGMLPQAAAPKASSIARRREGKVSAKRSHKGLSDSFAVMAVGARIAVQQIRRAAKPSSAPRSAAASGEAASSSRPSVASSARAPWRSTNRSRAWQRRRCRSSSVSASATMTAMASCKPCTVAGAGTTTSCGAAAAATEVPADASRPSELARTSTSVAGNSSGSGLPSSRAWSFLSTASAATNFAAFVGTGTAFGPHRFLAAVFFRAIMPFSATACAPMGRCLW